MEGKDMVQVCMIKVILLGNSQFYCSRPLSMSKLSLQILEWDYEMQARFLHTIVLTMALDMGGLSLQLAMAAHQAMAEHQVMVEQRMGMYVANSPPVFLIFSFLNYVRIL